MFMLSPKDYKRQNESPNYQQRKNSHGRQQSNRTVNN